MDYQKLNENENWKKIFEAASKAYPDRYLDTVMEDFLKGNEHSTGDTLAEFIVCELAETFDPAASFEDQIWEAQRVMVNAERDVAGVRRAIELLNTCVQ